MSALFVSAKLLVKVCAKFDSPLILTMTCLWPRALLPDLDVVEVRFDLGLKYLHDGVTKSTFSPPNDTQLNVNYNPNCFIPANLYRLSCHKTIFFVFQFLSK